ncbi:MAG: ATP-binding protein, partial [Bacteroidaceae bacterium]
GLGLAICAALADNCNIHIDVSSIEKDGSIFWIKAPLKHTAVPKKDYDYTAIHAILEQIKKREQ